MSDIVIPKPNPLTLKYRNEEYATFFGASLLRLSRSEIQEYRVKTNEAVWSARISTGLFGLTTCSSGNNPYVPKGTGEVVLAFGDEGLRNLVNSGFIPCPSCKPQDANNIWPDFDMWKIIADIAKKKYGVKSLEDFANKKIVDFDARRVDFEKIIPVTKTFSSRLYVPPGLNEVDVADLEYRLIRLHPYFDMKSLRTYKKCVHYFQKSGI